MVLCFNYLFIHSSGFLFIWSSGFGLLDQLKMSMSINIILDFLRCWHLLFKSSTALFPRSTLSKMWMLLMSKRAALFFTLNNYRKYFHLQLSSLHNIIFNFLVFNSYSGVYSNCFLFVTSYVWEMKVQCVRVRKAVKRNFLSLKTMTSQFESRRLEHTPLYKLNTKELTIISWRLLIVVEEFLPLDWHFYMFSLSC